MSETPAPQYYDEDTARAMAMGFGLFALMRQIERNRPGSPRIGENRTLSEELLTLGQDPSLNFPVSDLSEVSREMNGKWRLRSNVLGLFGPQGPLPLSLTEEAMRWSQSGDRSYTEFTDVFATRFLQLYFRVWSDSHGISQHDRPEDDRFVNWLGAFAGSGTPAFRKRDSVPDSERVYLASLGQGRVRSPVRLRQILEIGLRDKIRIEEHQISWIEIEPGDQCRLGQRGSSIGQNLFLGSRIRTVNDRIAIRIGVPDLKRYRAYLPGGAAHQKLCDLVFWYARDLFAIQVSISLPANQIPAAKLGESGELGWMAAIAPKYAANDDRPVTVTEFMLDVSAARAGK